jgi:anti-anti-sigma regulatory factor
VSGELDIARAPQLDAALVILDPRELELMHSSGAHLIEAANGRARQAAVRLVVVRDLVELEWISVLVGLDRHEPGRSSTSAARLSSRAGVEAVTCASPRVTEIRRSSSRARSTQGR